MAPQPIPTPPDVEQLIAASGEWSFDEEWSFDDEWPKVLEPQVEEGRFYKLWPEDDVAHKLTTHSLDELTDDELDVFNERVMPLLHAYVFEPATFEVEYARRHVPGFYDPPPDPRQLTLFAV